jgi:hypothetical protein
MCVCVCTRAQCVCVCVCVHVCVRSDLTVKFSLFKDLFKETVSLYYDAVYHANLYAHKEKVIL